MAKFDDMRWGDFTIGILLAVIPFVNLLVVIFVAVGLVVVTLANLWDEYVSRWWRSFSRQPVFKKKK